MNNTAPRLAVLAPHVVQYHSPIYRALSKRDDLAVQIYYESPSGLDAYRIEGFDRDVQWDIDLLDGYEHKFLRNRGGKAAWGGFFSRTNTELPGLITRSGMDGVLVQGYATFSDWLAVAKAKMVGVRVLYRGEAVLEGRAVGAKFRAWMKRVFLKTWLSLCDVVLYSCAANRRYYEHFGVNPRKLCFMPCCVDNDYFQAQRKSLASRRQAIREECGIGPGDFAVGIFSRLIDLKRPFDVLEAVSALDDDRVVVVFVGDGPLRRQLEHRAANLGVRAIFAGFVNQSGIGRWYTAMDAAAAVSAYDPSPKAVNEAMNFGLPIIASDVVGTVGDLVVHEKNGIVVPKGDIGALAGAIRQLQTSPKKRAAYGDAALEKVLEWTPARAAESIASSLAEQLHRN